MPSAWRIVKARRAKRAFDGEGARLFGGRWTRVGRPAVYVSGSIALAALELLVHLNDARPLAAYALFEVAIPDALITQIDAARLPSNWSDFPAPAQLPMIGQRWLEGSTSLALCVPSAIVKVEFNYVLNPRHPDFAKIVIGPQQPFEMDPRLL
ncbi:MAG: RES family NAD+ phosphorylase [Gemmatimonadaceae bacterium]